MVPASMQDVPLRGDLSYGTAQQGRCTAPYVHSNPLSFSMCLGLSLLSSQQGLGEEDPIYFPAGMCRFQSGRQDFPARPTNEAESFVTWSRDGLAMSQEATGQVPGPTSVQEQQRQSPKAPAFQ